MKSRNGPKAKNWLPILVRPNSRSWRHTKSCPLKISFKISTLTLCVKALGLILEICLMRSKDLDILDFQNDLNSWCKPIVNINLSDPIFTSQPLQLVDFKVYIYIFEKARDESTNSIRIPCATQRDWKCIGDPLLGSMFWGLGFRVWEF